MDSSVSPKEEIWFLFVCHHISNAVYDAFSFAAGDYLQFLRVAANMEEIA
jgi:hypothetical protein